MGIIVCDKPSGEGTLPEEGPSFARRYVIYTDPMTLERGPGFRVDAFEVLEKSLATFEIATSNLVKNKNHSKTFVSLLLDALAEAFKMPASHNSHGSKMNGGGSKVVKITTTTGGCALCAEEHIEKLERLGIVQIGGKDQVVQQQPLPQQPSADSYFATCFGCLVAIECCQCLMECGEYLEEP